MGVAYFLVFDKEVPGFKSCFEGKAVARAVEANDAITERLGLKGIADLTSWSRLDRVFGVPVELRETSTLWLKPKEGIEWVIAIRGCILSRRSLVKEAEAVLNDLDGYVDVLQKAAEAGARWHFEMDL